MPKPDNASASTSRLVLFVCTGNICRSPMAEALLRHHLPAGTPWRVASAGTCAFDGDAASEGAINALSDAEISLPNHRSQLLTAKRFDYEFRKLYSICVRVTDAGGSQSGNLLNVYSSGGTLLSGITAGGGLFAHISSTAALNIHHGSIIAASPHLLARSAKRGAPARTNATTCPPTPWCLRATRPAR